MRVCQINTVYAQGSTGRIVQDLHQGMKRRGIESYVCYPVPNHVPPEKGVSTFSNRFLNMASAAWRRLTGDIFGGARLQTHRLLRQLDRLRPDLVQLHCINGNNINVRRLLTYLAQNRIKTVLTLHAEFMYTGGCGHALECERYQTGCGSCPYLGGAVPSVLFDRTHKTWLDFQSCYRKFEKGQLQVIAVSGWLCDRARQAPLLTDFPIETIENGIDTRVFRTCDYKSLKKRLGLGEEKVILHVTAAFDGVHETHKGGTVITRLAKRLSGKPCRVIIAANYGSPDGLPDNAVYFGRSASAAELAQLYSLADLCVVTSRRETFSMVCAESLSCGTPVVGFEAGAPERIALPAYSSFVPYGDEEQLYAAVCQMLTRKRATPDMAQRISEEARAVYSRERMVDRYLKVYERMLGEE